MDTARLGQLIRSRFGGSAARSPGATAQAWSKWGFVLGIVLTAMLLLALAHDRGARIEAGQRQRLAVARSIDVLVHHEVEHLERTLRTLSIKADRYAAGLQAPPAEDIDADIRDVIAGNPELEDIGLYARTGTSLRPLAGSGDLSAALAATATGDGDFRIGTMEMEGHAQPVLPVALRTPGHNWLVARVRASDLMQLLDSVDVGSGGGALILDRKGRVLAGAGGGERYLGRAIAMPVLGKGATHAVIADTFDGIKRHATFTSASGYPFVVAVGTTEREILGTWWTFVQASVLFLLCYWVGFFHSSRSLSRSERARAQAQSELVRHADWLGKAQDASRAGVWALDLDRNLVQASAHTASMFGFAARDAVIPVRDFFERMHPDDRAGVQAVLADAIASGGAFHSEYRIVLPDGSVRWIDASGGRVGPDDPKLMTGTVIDVTERRSAQQEIARAGRQFRALFDSNPLPFWVYETGSLRFLAANEAAVLKYGYSVEEFLGMTILDIRPVEDRHDVVKSAASQGRHNGDRIWRHQTRDGTRIFVRVHSSPIEFDGRDARLVLAEDVSERVAHEERLAWQATHEEATGLLKLGALLADVDIRNGDSAIGYAVLYLQLRDLEIVAPTLGRRLGQAIVTEVARRLAVIADDFGPVAYVPADAFVLVSRDAQQVDLLCQQVSAALAQPVEFGGGSHRVDAWMGVATVPAGASSRAESAVDHAALAALQSRNHAEGVIKYSEGMAEESAQRLALIARLRNAIANEELELHFQPIVEVSSGRITAAEALLRWRGGDGGYVPPSVFVPLAEESGQIIAIGQWVIEQATLARLELDGQGFANVAISVNVSAMQLTSGDITGLMRRMIEAAGVSQGGFHVEITESAMLKNQDVVRRALETLRAAGVDISIDDFGTGFSSMAYLRELPLDYLKIDRSFVAGVDRDAKNASICRALIALAHGIGLQVIAEGVERRAEYDWLAAHGCDHVQGYFIARPGPLGGLLEHLANDRRPPRTVRATG